MTSFDKAKLTLVEFFMKNEYYTVYKTKPKKNNNAYLYKIDNKAFQVIKIVDNFNADFDDYKVDDDDVLALKAYLQKKFQRAKVTTLSIIFVENRSHVVKEKSGDINLFVDNDNYLNKIKDYYPNINPADSSEEDENLKEMSAEELMEIIQNPDSKLTKNLKQISDKLTLSNIILTWILIIFLAILPFMNFFSPESIFENMIGLDPSSTSLVYGGLTRDLLTWSDQWWRLWTYPLFETSPFMFIININLIFVISKYSEALIGRIRIIIFLVFGVPLVGLLLSAALPNSVFAGETVLLAILWGGLFSYNYGKDDLGALISNQKTLFIPIWLILLPLFNGLDLYLIILSGFFVGSALGFLTEFNHLRKINLTIIYPIFILSTVVIVGGVLLSIQKYVPPLNGPAVTALIRYYLLGVMNKSTIQDMLTNYYHYPESEWPESLKSMAMANNIISTTLVSNYFFSGLKPNLISLKLK